MTTQSFPFDNQDTTETQYSKLFRELQDTGIVGPINGTDCQVTGTGTGMQVTVAPGLAIVRGHMYWADANSTVTIAAAGAAQRYDSIVLRLDPAANQISLVALTGVVNAGFPPAPTQTDTGIYELPIATISVPSGTVSIAAGQVTDIRPFTGTRVGVWHTGTRPASPRPNQFGYNVDLGYFERWDSAGVIWANAFKPKWSDLTTKPTKLVAQASSAKIVTGNVIYSGTVPAATGSRIVVKWSGRAGFDSVATTVCVDVAIGGLGASATPDGSTNGQLVNVGAGQWATVTSFAQFDVTTGGTFSVTLTANTGTTAFFQGVVDIEVWPST